MIADDNPLFVDMLAALLSREERIAIVGKARDGIEAIELTARFEPDVTLTGSNAAAEVDRSRQAGAAGYLTKDHVGATLVETILQIAAR